MKIYFPIAFGGLIRNSCASAEQSRRGKASSLHPAAAAQCDGPQPANHCNTAAAAAAKTLEKKEEDSFITDH